MLGFQCKLERCSLALLSKRPACFALLHFRHRTRNYVTSLEFVERVVYYKKFAMAAFVSGCHAVRRVRFLLTFSFCIGLDGD